MRIGVIDLGTNTFNLLVADISNNGNLSIVYRDELGIKLGQGGINRKVITDEAYERGIQGFRNHLLKAERWEPEDVLAVATSGIRSTKNGARFIQEIRKRFGIAVKTITGEEEAELIYRGARQAVNMKGETALIIDIGGGSNEFIIGNQDNWFWKKSLDIGIARILEQFKPSDPITNSEIQQMNKHYEEALTPLLDPMEKYHPGLFIGCAGTFQTVRHMLREEGVLNNEDKQQPSVEISYEHFKTLHDKLLRSTAAERKEMKGLELFRVDMIVLAGLFVNFIMEKWSFKKMVQSEYSILEGVVDQYINS
jgi:exopolyphosphatase/guanosine-5'-triphosphate,3'-diphosphate pyrophosphatase